MKPHHKKQDGFRAYNFIASDQELDFGMSYCLMVFFRSKAERKRFARWLKTQMKAAGHPNADKLRVPDDGGDDGWGL